MKLSEFRKLTENVNPDAELYIDDSFGNKGLELYAFINNRGNSIEFAYCCQRKSDQEVDKFIQCQIKEYNETLPTHRI